MTADDNLKGTIYDFSNPKRTGPGVWFSFHLNAAQSKDRNERLFVCKQIRDFCLYFKCGKCQAHCREYLTKSPPENTVNTEEGLFRWTINFRNAVQDRLKAPKYDYDIMHSIFYDESYGVCKQDCDKAAKEYIEFNVPQERAHEVREIFGGNIYSDGKMVRKSAIKITPFRG